MTVLWRLTRSGRELKLISRQFSYLAGKSAPISSNSSISFHCSNGETSVFAAFIPEPLADGTPMPGKVESPQWSNPGTLVDANGKVDPPC